ncbi:MAG TPA: cupin domain-containing protein [Chitinophagaceae bacterium]|nr:cupin domain-containing protein [Chitinophagaceae bacterium]
MLLLVRLCWREWTKIIIIWDAEAEIIRNIYTSQQTRNNHFIWRTNPETEFFTAEQCYITEVFNQMDRPEASMAHARVEPGITTQKHSLQGTAEWYYILQGTGEMYVNHEVAGQVASGDIVYVPAGTPQQITNTGNEDLVFLCFCVPRFTPGAYSEISV